MLQRLFFKKAYAIVLKKYYSVDSFG